ncbi:hypothetical protein DENSPDRAFT_270837 [Dentipellis sp. KUC8613]|nr:hypothetical protein DENSPDRAFT_270837 [Dentipellis sp. KUC8613]
MLRPWRCRTSRCTRFSPLLPHTAFIVIRMAASDMLASARAHFPCKLHHEGLLISQRWSETVFTIHDHLFCFSRWLRITIGFVDLVGHIDNYSDNCSVHSRAPVAPAPQSPRRIGTEPN